MQRPCPPLLPQGARGPGGALPAPPVGELPMALLQMDRTEQGCRPSRALQPLGRGSTRVTPTQGRSPVRPRGAAAWQGAGICPGGRCWGRREQGGCGGRSALPQPTACWGLLGQGSGSRGWAVPGVLCNKELTQARVVLLWAGPVSPGSPVPVWGLLRVLPGAGREQGPPAPQPHPVRALPSHRPPHRAGGRQTQQRTRV